MRARLLPLLGAAIIAGCSSTSPTEVQQTRLTAAMQRWAVGGSLDYQFQLRWLCGECLPEWSHLLQIRVQNGQVTDVVDLTAGGPVAKNSRTLTIPELFAHIQLALDQDAHYLFAEYHPTLGYPVTVAVDWSYPAVDDEGGFDVGSVQLLP